VGLSLFGNSLPLVLSAVNIAFSSDASIFYVLGGPGVNGVEGRILERFKSVFAVVRGEGELAMVYIASSLSSEGEINWPGVFTRRKTGGLVLPQRAVRIREVDSIAWPNWDCVDLRAYSRRAVLTARGCPFDCSFCDVSAIWGRKVAARSIEDVVNEIRYITVSDKRKRVELLDDTLTANRRRVIELSRLMSASTMGVTWSCFARVDTVDQELLGEMCRGGCRSVFFGIDGGNYSTRRAVGKQISQEDVIAGVSNALLEPKLRVTVSFIWGYPEETFEDFGATVECAYELSRLGESSRRLVTQLHLLAPIPATPLFSKFRDQLAFDEDVGLGFLNGRALRAYRGTDEYEECREMILSDRVLFAPFYHYLTPDFGEKQHLVRSSRPGRRGQAIGSRKVAAQLRYVRRQTQIALDCLGSA